MMTRNRTSLPARSHPFRARVLTAGAAACLVLVAESAAAAVLPPSVLPSAPSAIADAVQDPGRRGRDEPRGNDGGQQRLDMSTLVSRVERGRQGRRVGVRDQGNTVVVIWEYPGGRVVEIMVDARTGRIMGER